MAKRLLLSLFMALVACGVLFYLTYFAGLMLSAASGPLNPANSPRLQWTLRYVGVPLSLAAGSVMFAVSFRKSKKIG